MTAALPAVLPHFIPRAEHERLLAEAVRAVVWEWVA